MFVALSKLPANRFLLIQHESGLPIVRQGVGMIQGAGVQPEPLWPVAPGFVDAPLQEPFPEALADEFTDQPELGQLDLIRLASVQLGKPSGPAIDVQDVQLVAGIGENSVVERAVMLHGWRLNVNHGQLASRGQYETI